MWAVVALIVLALSLRALLPLLASAYFGLSRPVSPQLSNAYNDL